MLAIRRYIFRRQCMFALLLFLLLNIVFFFIKYDSLTLPKWPSITHRGWGNGGNNNNNNNNELDVLVKHLETEMENHSRNFRKKEKHKSSRRGHHHNSCKQNNKLLVVVQSKTTNFDRRNIIRSTWGDGCTKCRHNNRWMVFFLTGQSRDGHVHKQLTEEGDEHGDMIPVDTVDGMKNITDKLTKGFTWAVRHCRFSYLLKTNDNTFVNIPTLYKYLDHPQTPKHDLYAGNVNWWSRVLREGIYGVGDEYKRDFYPRYCSGAAYVLSRDAVLKFVRNFSAVEYLFIEDAYIGEVALRSGVDVTHSKKFVYAKGGCDYNSTYMSYHAVNSADCMMKMYQQTLPLFMSIYN